MDSSKGPKVATYDNNIKVLCLHADMSQKASFEVIGSYKLPNQVFVHNNTQGLWTLF